jgi:WD40 repeat protein
VYIGGKTGLDIWPLTNRINGALALDPAQARRMELPASVGARALALSLDGHSAAVELTDHRLEVLDLTGKRAPVFLKDRFRLLNLKGSGSATGAGRFVLSPDGRAVAVGYNFGADDVPSVWDTQTGELLARLNANNSVVTFSPDGQWLALAGMSQYSLWSAGDWRLLKAFDRDELSITRGAVACGRDGGLLAVTSTQKKVALLSGSADDKLFDLISPVPESITSVRLSVDGSELVTATASDDVQVWRLGHLRQEMAAMNLGWTPGQTTAVPTADAPPGLGTELSNTRVTLALSLAGVLLAGVFAVITLRQHRASVARFIQAEVKTAQHNRALELAKAELAHS